MTSWSSIPSLSAATAASRNIRTAAFACIVVKDRTNPKLVSFVKTRGKGVHRFDIDEKYAYISTEMEGYIGNILVIYDIRDPSRPVEVSRWSMERQNVAGGDEPHTEAGPAPPAPCAALRHRDVRRLLDVGHLDHERNQHQCPAYAVALRV